MKHYTAQGNLPQKADYYALLNRSDARFMDIIKQGLVAEGDGTSAGYKKWL